MKLGRYEVVRELGKGAMGIVYLAKDPLIGRLVALKTIRVAAHADEEEAKEFQQRFIREAQAAGILNHPSIVTVHDIGQDEATGTSFIAMEYVEGYNLKEVLAQGRPLSFEQAAEVIAQVAEALDFAHAKGIVHRDVKPANIILVEGNRAKITDFGIAKIASGAANLTTTGQFLGTPNYMAPEQIKGAPVDGRTDIFSLGICLYECLTRRKPFGGDSLTSISYKIVHEPFVPLREINPQIPEPYEDVIARCLAKEPSRRFQRGRDLANALRAAARGERTPTDPVVAEETIVTRGHDKIPTVEVPFPEAIELDPTPDPLQTKPRPLVTIPAVAAVAGSAEMVAAPFDLPPGEPAVAEAGVAPAKPKRPPIRQQLRKTLSNVRAYPVWKMPVAPPVFLSIVGALVLTLIAAVIVIQSRHPDIPAVDEAVEARRAREKQLRAEGNELLRQGRVREAHAKFSELRALAPKSPYVASVMARLDAALHREQQKIEITRQQLALADQKLQEGIARLQEKKYAEAIILLEEAFHLNPNSDDAANYLKAAQQEEQMALARRPAASTPTASATAAKPAVKPPPRRVVSRPPPAASSAVPARPAQITTYFESPFSDGYIMVKAGAQVVAHENLWEEKGRFIRRKSPRVVNVTSEIEPSNTDLQIWVVVPAQKISEHKVLPRNFGPGSAHKLIVSFDAQSRTFGYQLN
ncbi:MAG TPA: protein kinase [Thermoanaerobaculia bacterium]|nr:protein kinase [Thermoanaerobaculia bacterium]